MGPDGDRIRVVVSTVAGTTPAVVRTDSTHGPIERSSFLAGIKTETRGRDTAVSRGAGEVTAVASVTATRGAGSCAAGWR